MITKPVQIITSEYFAGYVKLAEGESLIESLRLICEQSLAVCDKITEVQSNQAYADGKWSVKQLLQHVIDTERVFNYRALSIARGDCQNLCGFDENNFAANDFAMNRHWTDLLEEYVLLRKSTIALFSSFSEVVLDYEGRANGVDFTPRILGWVLVGHDQHHMNVLKERYLPIL